MKLPEFIKLVKEFYRDKSNSTAAKSWINKLEKVFTACAIPNDKKLSLAVLLLKKDAKNWWRRVSMGMAEPTYIISSTSLFLRLLPRRYKRADND